GFPTLTLTLNRNRNLRLILRLSLRLRLELRLRSGPEESHEHEHFMQRQGELMKKDRLLLALLLVLLAVFGLGVGRLFQLRFEAGDVYPPYSSLRADPLGTKAFFEGLKILHGITVERLFQQLDRLREGRRTTL